MRSRFDFNTVSISVGSELTFAKADMNENFITATVCNDKKIKFREEVISLSKSAEIILKELGYNWK